MNPLAAPNPETRKLPEIPQMPPEAPDELGAAPDTVLESGLTQGEKKEIIQHLAKASDHLEEHKLALEHATAALKRTWSNYFFRFLSLI